VPAGEDATEKKPLQNIVRRCKKQEKFCSLTHIKQKQYIKKENIFVVF
jgi:hypothetical protein